MEVRYDCVWTGACGLFPSANAAFADKPNPFREGDIGLSVLRDRDELFVKVRYTF